MPCLDGRAVDGECDVHSVVGTMERAHFWQIGRRIHCSQWRLRGDVVGGVSQLSLDESELAKRWELWVELHNFPSLSTLRNCNIELRRVAQSPHHITSLLSGCTMYSDKCSHTKLMHSQICYHKLWWAAIKFQFVRPQDPSSLRNHRMCVCLCVAEGWGGID